MGEIGREGLLQAAVGYVEVSLMLRACHDAQATDGRLYRINRWKMKVRIQLSGPLRSKVSKQRDWRRRLQPQNAKSVVEHGTK